MEKIKTIYTDRVDKVIELVGSTLPDSVQCTKGGTICQAGIVGGNNNSDLRYALPTGATYGGGQKDFHAVPLQELAKQVVDSTLPVYIGGTFHTDETIKADRTTEQNTAGGKIVALTYQSVIRLPTESRFSTEHCS